MTSQSPLMPTHLEPSPLGTKKYWDTLYENELSNHAADPSDVGTVWFDDSAAEDKILAFLRSPILNLDHEHTSFLDIGTGNGHLLFRLRDSFNSSSTEEVVDNGGDDDDDDHSESKPSSRNLSFKGRMLGTDYSTKSIEFARRLAASRSPSSSSSSASITSPLAIDFLHHDIMTSSASAILTPPNEDGFDVVLDKGTFDAISLSDEALQPPPPLPLSPALGPASASASGDGKEGKKEKRRLCEGYAARILPLVRDGGVFVVTSCNWTEEELRGWFEGERGEGGEEGKEEKCVFVFEKGLQYRRFRFGGREGQSISSVCFRKRRRGG